MSGIFAKGIPSAKAVKNEVTISEMKVFNLTLTIKKISNTTAAATITNFILKVSFLVLRILFVRAINRIDEKKQHNKN